MTLSVSQHAGHELARFLAEQFRTAKWRLMRAETMHDRLFADVDQVGLANSDPPRLHPLARPVRCGLQRLRDQADLRCVPSCADFRCARLLVALYPCGWNHRFPHVQPRVVRTRRLAAHRRKVPRSYLELVSEAETGDPLPMPPARERKAMVRRVRGSMYTVGAEDLWQRNASIR